MNKNIEIPELLIKAIDGEETNFIVKPKRESTRRGLWSTLFFSIIWIGLLVAFYFIGGDQLQWEVDLTSPIIHVFIALWFLIGILPSVYAVYSFFFKKTYSYFVATPTRLIHFDKNKIRYIDWEQFTGDIIVGGSDKEADLTLILRTGYKKTDKDDDGSSSEYFEHSRIEITGVNDSDLVEGVCRELIIENQVGTNPIIPEIDKQELSAPLESYLKGEESDFSVNPTRKRPLSESLLLTGTGVILAITMILITIADGFNIWLFLGVIVALAILAFGIYTFFEGAGTFVGTSKELINSKDGVITTTPWHEYSGDITVTLEAGKGSINLGKKAFSSGYISDNQMGYIPEESFLLGIDNAFEISNICRKRIKENDLTPIK